MPQVIAALLLVGIASSASAECAWIFWGEFQEGPDPRTRARVTWERLQAFSKHEACMTQVRQHLSSDPLTLAAIRAGSKGEPALNLENGKAMWEDKKGVFHFWQFQCWPDTVDPRPGK